MIREDFYAGNTEGDIWYPDDEFLQKVHDLMLNRFGGYPGLRAGKRVFEQIISDVKSVKGIYRKAAILLRGLRTANIFEDANKRTAYVVTKAFLEMNDKKMKIKNSQEVYKFIKEILSYDIDEIEKWLRNDSLKERSGEGSAENSQRRL